VARRLTGQNGGVTSSRTKGTRFRATIEGKETGRAYLTLPFDPDDVWGAKPRHHLGGTVDGLDFHGAVERAGERCFLSLGPAFRRDRGLHVGDTVSVELFAEGPQREALAPDLAAALAANPRAAAFFDGLATFYRKGYLRWIDATKRRPDVRAERIAELIEHLEAGHKTRPDR
jgi:hypothetical protein